jgi:hypothetical protein
MHVALIGAEFEENLAVRCLVGALQAAGCRPGCNRDTRGCQLQTEELCH